MSDAVVWLHADWVSLNGLGEAPAVFVFDDEQLRAGGWSLKRIGFLYECLLELPVEIRRGDPVAEVVAFAGRHEAARVVTMDAPDAHLRRQFDQVRTRINLEIRPEPAFVEPTGPIDLRRFSLYWQKAMPRLIP